MLDCLEKLVSLMPKMIANEAWQMAHIHNISGHTGWAII